MESTVENEYLRVIRAHFLILKRSAENTISQVKESDLERKSGPESNSIANLMRHISGNIISRFTDFLTSDGEKADRNRDGEFADGPADKKTLMELWEKAWGTLTTCIDGLKSDDLLKTIYINHKPHSVLEALNIAIYHYSWHVGQIVMLGKQFSGKNWQTLSIPKGKSEEYLRKKREKYL